MLWRSIRLALSGTVGLSALACGDDGGSYDGAAGELGQTREAAKGDLDPLAAGISFSTALDARSEAVSCITLGCNGFGPERGTVGSKRTRGSNSQTEMGRRMFFGDFDGDGQADYLQYWQSRLFATRASPEGGEVGHVFLRNEIDRIFVGDFYGAGWDQVCAITGEMLRCYGMNGPEDDQFRFWFQHAHDISSDEDIIVGDYDGDERDEVLFYNRDTGAFRMWEVEVEHFFTLKSDWEVSNLTRAGSSNVRWRVGDVDGDGKDDLVSLGSSNRASVFKSVRNEGKTKFWWGFTTVRDFISDDEDLMLARVDDNLGDDFVIHDASSGGVRFHRVAYDDGRPAALPIETGQIRIRDNSRLVMQYSHQARSEAGSDVRDDAFVYDVGNRRIYKSEARWDNARSKYTYWYDYSHFAPDNHYGWPAVTRKKVLFQKCRFSDVASTPPNTNRFFRDLTDRIADYFGEITYGGLDISKFKLKQTWYDLGATEASFGTVANGKRTKVSDACLAASGEQASDYDAIVTFTNNDGGGGASGNRANLGTQVFDVWVAVQEIAHTLGWAEHGRNDLGENYGDPWDVMSGRTNGYTYTNGLGVLEGPGMNAFNRTLFDYVPEQRINTIAEGSSPRTVGLTALNRPGSRQYLQIRAWVSATRYYSIEYRETTGFDQAIPRNTVLIHEIKNGKSYLQTKDDDGTLSRWSTAERLEGEEYTTPDGVRVEVQDIDPLAHIAKVRVSYSD